MGSEDRRVEVRADFTPERLALCDPSLITVKIEPDGDLLDSLTDEERARFQRKLGIVADAAARMAANMLKGTLKYTRDDWDDEAWDHMEEDDLADALNYHLLRRAGRKAR